MFWLLDKFMEMLIAIVKAADKETQETPQQATIRLAMDPPKDAVIYRFRNGEVRYYKGQLVLVDRLGIVKAVRHKNSMRIGGYIDPQDAAYALYTEFWPVTPLSYRVRRA
jgi:hypothetical protein